MNHTDKYCFDIGRLDNPRSLEQNVCKKCSVNLVRFRKIYLYLLSWFMLQQLFILRSVNNCEIIKYVLKVI